MANIPPFNLITKPTGPLCNLDCVYCYYLEKEKLFPEGHRFVMDDETLESYTRQYIHEQPGREVTFVWQGGEPTLLGIDYFRKALLLQKKYGSGKLIYNSFQTNGVLLNDEWCRFFKENNFLIGISIDGPEEIHDRYRYNKGGQGTFARVMNGISLLKKHGVDFNTLTVVNNLNAEEPLRVYRFLKEAGSGYMQFIPIVERVSPNGTVVTSWSVPSLKFGKFLVAIFNEWIKRDAGRYFVQQFDAALANEVGHPAGICTFNKYCGTALAIENNGDVYACDHYVYPEYKRGNIRTSRLKNIVMQESQIKFGNDKYDKLPSSCKQCDVLNYCYGECPKNRFLFNNKGEPGLNYLCEGYKHFFRHVKPYMKQMAKQISLL